MITQSDALESPRMRPLSARSVSVSTAGADATEPLAVPLVGAFAAVAEAALAEPFGGAALHAERITAAMRRIGKMRRMRESYRTVGGPNKAYVLHPGSPMELLIVVVGLVGIVVMVERVWAIVFRAKSDGRYGLMSTLWLHAHEAAAVLGPVRAEVGVLARR